MFAGAASAAPQLSLRRSVEVSASVREHIRAFRGAGEIPGMTAMHLNTRDDGYQVPAGQAASQSPARIDFRCPACQLGYSLDEPIDPNAHVCFCSQHGSRARSKLPVTNAGTAAAAAALNHDARTTAKTASAGQVESKVAVGGPSPLHAHSCGEPCASTGLASRSCAHACPLLCHPGPCPPCEVVIGRAACACGKTQQDVRCSGQVCRDGGKPLQVAAGLMALCCCFRRVIRIPVPPGLRPGWSPSL